MTGNEFADWLEKKYLDWQYLNGRASIRNFAKWLDVNQALVVRYMNGKERPGPKILPKLAEKLGYAVYDVLGLARPDEVEETLIRQYRSIPPEHKEEYSQALREFIHAWSEHHGYEWEPDEGSPDDCQDKSP